MSDDDDVEDLGRCCGCRTTQGVRNIVMLHQKSPIPGRGWGCLQCGASQDGALAVVCDRCLERAQERGWASVLVEACRGYLGKDGRVPYASLTGRHEHDPARHPEVVET